MMNDGIKKLLDLQKIDKVIDGYLAQMEEIPLAVLDKHSQIQQAKQSEEEIKNKVRAFQLKKKEKELELATHEEKIKKREAELNSLNSNEAYKAVLSEINQSKKEKELIEDAILTIMLESDTAQQGIAQVSQEAKDNEKKFLGEIKILEEESSKLQALVNEEKKVRDDYTAGIPADVIKRYNYIREHRKGSALMAIKGECCDGCNTNLTQSVINEVKKGKDMIICESCSSILYFPADPKPASDENVIPIVA